MINWKQIRVKGWSRNLDERSQSMLYFLIAVLLLLWLLGIGFHVAGGLIHLLLIIALIVLIYDLFTRRRSRL